MINFHQLLRISAIALTSIALLTTTAVAQSPAEGDHSHEHDIADDDQAFEEVVRGIDTLPERQQLEERWPDAQQRLMEMASDADRTVFERWRATSLLGNFVEPEVRQALIDLSGDDEPRIRAMAYYALGAAFLDDGDDALFAHLKDGLDDDADRVPVRVVRSFGWTDHTEAHRLLEEIIDGQHDDDLISHAERALERHSE